jgi:hypothetical protein
MKYTPKQVSSRTRGGDFPNKDLQKFEGGGKGQLGEYNPSGAIIKPGVNAPEGFKYDPKTDTFVREKTTEYSSEPTKSYQDQPWYQKLVKQPGVGQGQGDQNLRKLTDEQVFWNKNTDKLKELKDKGLSSSEIAKELGVSRNSVIGRLDRLKKNK